LTFASIVFRWAILAKCDQWADDEHGTKKIMPNLSMVIDRLGVDDISKHPVWEYKNHDAINRSDRRVHPIANLPVKSLDGCLVGVQIRLKNGATRWAVLSNITLTNPKRTKHFLAVWIENNGKWFELARYFDVDYKRRGPRQLAAFLGLSVEEVFPMSYDITGIAQGDAATLQGQVEDHPKERLTEDEIIALSLTDD
jgi:hypothetical protein